jgi:hypothetical protein
MFFRMTAHAGLIDADSRNMLAKKPAIATAA